MKKLFILICVTFTFQYSYANLTESCRLEKLEVTAEDGQNGGIQIGMVLENGKAVSVSDDIQISQVSADKLSEVLSQEARLKTIIDSLHLVLENVASLNITKIASDATVIRFMDENGKLLAKVGRAQDQVGVCQTENQSSPQTP